jgi:hypothetical protein
MNQYSIKSILPFMFFYFGNLFILYIFLEKIYLYILKGLQKIFWLYYKVPEELQIKLVPEELINLIYEFQKNSTISVPEELENFIYEFQKNSTISVPEELENFI